LIVPGAVDAETIQATVRDGERLRLVELKREGGEILVPLLACGSLLGADARWYPATNQWEMKGKAAFAKGFLDEPLLFIEGQPVLVKHPPRLIAGLPYLSLETLRSLGQHGWEIDLVWHEAAQELEVKPAQLQQATVTERTRTLAVPKVPAGSRVIVLDAGHVRRAGARGLKGLTEGDLGLKLAAAVSATLAGEGLALVTLQGDGKELDPREAAGLANALKAEFFVSFHASEYGGPGPVVWYWGLSNLLGTTNVSFKPFESRGGWTRAAEAGALRALEVGTVLVQNLEESGIPADGPYPAPLVALEGLNCPAIAISIDGFGTPEGASLVGDDAAIQRLAGVIAATLRVGLVLPEASR